MSRHRVLVVTRNYPPLTGGMERLLQHTVEALADRFEVTVIGPAGGHRSCPTNARYIGCPATPLLFIGCALIKGLWQGLRSRPALVVGGSGLVAPVTTFLGRLTGAKTMIFVHGLDLVVRSRPYQRFFVPSIKRHDVVLANSGHTRGLALDQGCDAGQIRILHPGVAIPDDDRTGRRQPLATRGELADRSIMLFVGRMIRRKGLAPFIEHAWPRVRQMRNDAVLLVVGDSPDDALMRDSGGGREIADAVKAADPGSIVFLGAVDDRTLGDCYASAACLVFPLIAVPGDVEGFGMVAVEAAAHGTPTVAFAEGGVGDAVHDGESGYLVAPGDHEAFARRLVEIANGDGPDSQQCRTFAERFAWPRYGKSLNALADEVIAGKRIP